MHNLFLSLTRLPFPAGWTGVYRAGWIGLLIGSVLVSRVAAQEPPAAARKDEFSSLVKLAPFVVSGKSLAISIYARTRSDRRYGEQFSERVAKVVYEGVTQETGKGLVIIGAKGEPHPAMVFRKFRTLASAGMLDPAVAAQSPELSATLDEWEQRVRDQKSQEGDEDLGMDFERIFVALPLPLRGIAAQLYQLAWEEKFDDAKVDAKLRSLSAEELKRRNRFESFDWVFYLPPKGAFDAVLDDLIAAALKQEKMGFVERMAAKSVLLVVKPKIRAAIEAMRQGMMFGTVVQAQTHYSEDDVSALADAYMEVFMPFSEKDERPVGRNAHERAVNAVREQLRINAEKAGAASSAGAGARGALPPSNGP